MAIGQERATLDDLAKVDGKAELIGGRIVRSMPTGFQPSQVAANIYVSLRTYVRQSGEGFAFTDNIGYVVPLLPSGRESFSPDASYFRGTPPDNRMVFLSGAPTFAVEVRSQGDQGRRAEAKLLAKRADYFAAGTLVVWDVDLLTEEIRSYLPGSPDRPRTFPKRHVADAEPAVPGWRMDVEDVFAP